MARKALKLEVPFRECTSYLCVTDGHGNAVEVDDNEFQGEHVVPCGNDAILVKNFFDVNNKVPDVSRYRIGAGGCCVRHDNRYHICNDRYLIPHCDVSRKDLARLLQRQQRRQVRNIVLLLESPHKDEYQPGNINCPIAPANGATGDNIDRCLGTVLRQIKGALINARLDEAEFIKPDSHVIISNPIQFQTSLHAIHGKSLQKKWVTLRNNVWWTLWNEQRIQRNFRARLKRYNPSLIINACTGKRSTKDVLTRTDALTRTHGLRSLVTRFVREELPKVPLYEAYHPAINWNNCDNTHLHRIEQPNCL